MSRRRADLDDVAVEYAYADSWRASLERRHQAEAARRRMRADTLGAIAEAVVLLVLAAIVAGSIAVIAPGL